jgi:hypothetical protein
LLSIFYILYSGKLAEKCDAESSRALACYTGHTEYLHGILQKIVKMGRRDLRMEEERGNSENVSALSAGAYTATLYLIVNRLKGGGRAPPTLTSQG